MKKWWRWTPEALAAELATDAAAGLTGEEAARRLAASGPNRLQEGPGRTVLGIFLEQFADFMIWVLIAAALVSGFLKEWVDAIAIIAIVLLNALLGFIQESRAEKSLQALRRMAAPMARAVRGGVHLSLPAEELVPGDLIELEAGDNVPADARIIGHTANFAVQEAGLTGESTPVLKSLAALEREDVPLGDRANQVFLGTSAVAGKARAVVVETGMRTELGKIAGMIQGIAHESTPLQKRLEQFGKFIIVACFALVGLVFLMGLLRGGQILDLFLTAVSLAVAAIPEGLPAVVTIALALGVQRMVKRNCLIRKLPAVETLGCATVICSDKTGTLTKNEMTVRAVVTARRTYQLTGTGYEPKGRFLRDGEEIDPASAPDLRETLRAAVLCNGASLVEASGRWSVVGDPTEGALLTAAAKAGIDRAALESAEPFLDEIPFDSERKRMTLLRRSASGTTAYVKGAPDILLERCTRILEDGRERPLVKADAAEVIKANEALSGQALRVLAVARRAFSAPPDAAAAEAVESDLTFLGLTAMIDPPREEAREAVAKCRTSGIVTVMITGDHKATAAAVGRELGMADADTLALTGEELDGLGDAELVRRLDHVRVYARVAPEHKLRIVRAWRKRGAIVAMTGDGVNDAPAVKEADIGVAMGLTGTDVTKEVSDMIITDDNFASIVAAVEEGRGIYDNIKKFIHYLLSCNAGEILVMFTASLLGWAVPLLPIQILWVNLITDGLPALALGMEPVDRDIMQRPPRRADEPIVDRPRGLLILAQGAFIALCSLAAFAFVFFVEKEGIDRARTAALIALAAAQLFHAFNCRCQRTSLFRLGLLSNPKLLLASGLSLVLQFGIIYLPFAQKVFKVVPLGLLDISVLLALASFPLWAMELIKAIPGLRRRLPEA
jgi:Ca2+-transporting ATPase